MNIYYTILKNNKTNCPLGVSLDKILDWYEPFDYNGIECKIGIGFVKVISPFQP